MKILIALLFLSIYGCIPKDGGLIANQDQGAIAPDDQFPNDYATLQNYFATFESRTPTSNYATMNGLFSEPINIVTPSTATVEYFLENGLSQSLMFSPNPQGLGGITVDFDLQTLQIKNFYYLGAGPAPYILIDPSPEDEIPIGTIVLVGINATENGVASSRWQNAYMLKIQNGSSYWYVWYGNQNPVYTP